MAGKGATCKMSTTSSTATLSRFNKSWFRKVHISGLHTWSKAPRMLGPASTIVTCVQREIDRHACEKEILAKAQSSLRLALTITEAQKRHRLGCTNTQCFASMSLISLIEKSAAGYLKRICKCAQWTTVISLNSAKTVLRSTDYIKTAKMDKAYTRSPYYGCF
eukprot:4766393-Pleurochrysis_carterae.AAC.2